MKERKELMAGKIDNAGLGAKVLELRKSLTCEEVADIINAKFLPAGVEPLSMMAVSRYCVSHGMADMERNDVSKKVTRFDTMSEAMTTLKRIDKRIAKMETLMDEMKDDEEKLSEIASISNAYANLLKWRQSLIEQVSKIQKEQMSVDRIRKVMLVLIELLRKYPEVYSDFMIKLRELDEYELIRSL